MPGLKRAQYRYRIKKADPSEEYRETAAEKEALRQRREPLSLEELIKRREDQKIIASRPKFLSKEERARLALERRQEAVQKSRAEHEALKEKRQKLEAAGASQLAAELKLANQRQMGADFSRTTIKDITGKPNMWVPANLSDEARRKEERQRQIELSEAERADEALRHMTSGELQEIKESYLGRQKESKILEERRRKQEQKKNRQNFDDNWNAEDDTTGDQANPLYANVHQTAMYGRGKVAGYDKSIKIDANDFYKEKNERFRFFCDGLRRYNKEQVIELAVEPEEVSRGVNRKKFQDLEGKWDMRHWAEKELNEMTERDWRILREDFSIATKGGNIPRPLRKLGKF